MSKYIVAVSASKGTKVVNESYRKKRAVFLARHFSKEHPSTPVHLFTYGLGLGRADFNPGMDTRWISIRYDRIATFLGGKKVKE